MVKFEQLLLVGNSCLSMKHLKTSFKNGWFLQESKLTGTSNINKDSLTESRKGSNLFQCNVTNWNPISAQDMISKSNDVSSNSLWFYNEFKQLQVRNIYNTQQISTLKTYAYHTIKTRQIRKKTDTSPSRIFEKLRKMYRETVKIKVNKTIMKKKKPCHLSSELINEGSLFDGLVKEKDKLIIDPVLSNHLLRQAEKKQSPDPNVSLNSVAYPYIPCPLKKPEDYALAKSFTCTYQHTSLAPLFTVDNIIIGEGKKLVPEIDKKPKSIKPNFWCQHSNDKNFEIKEVNQDVSNKLNEKNNKISLVNQVKNNIFETNRYLNEFKQIQNEPKQNLNQPRQLQNEPKQNLNQPRQIQNESKQNLNQPRQIQNEPKQNLSQPKLFQNESKQYLNEPKVSKEIKLLELFKPLETTEKNKTVEPKNPLLDSKQPVYIGKYYTVPNSEEKKKSEPTKNIQVLLSPKESVKKTVSTHDVKNRKHLNLNFPYQMTCPNQIKRIKKAASEADLIKRTMMKEADQFSKNNVNSSIYNSDKYCKQLKNYYTNGNTVTNKVDKREIKQLMEKISQLKTTDKTAKLQIPLTSPNINLKKNNENCKS